MKDSISKTVVDAIKKDNVDFDRVFVTVLLTVMTALLIMTLNYSETARLMPFLIGVPTWILLVLLLAYQTSSRFSQMVEGFTYNNVLDLDERIEGISDNRDSKQRNPLERNEARKRVVIIVSWITAAFGLILLVGFLTGLFVFLVVFYRIQAQQKWSLTLVYSLVAWVFIFIMFQVILNVPVYQGVLEINLVGFLAAIFN